MSFFEYISVMVSVILALGIARILGGIGQLLSRTPPARTYWIHSTWILFYFLFHVRIWWAYWDLRDAPPTNLLVFLFMLLGPSAAYLGTYLLIPGGFPVDARKHFYQVRRAFFGVGFVGVLSAFASPLFLGYSMPVGYFIGNGIGVGFVLLGWASDNRRVQAVVVLVSLLGFVSSFILRMTAGAFTPG